MSKRQKGYEQVSETDIPHVIKVAETVEDVTEVWYEYLDEQEERSSTKYLTALAAHAGLRKYLRTMLSGELL